MPAARKRGTSASSESAAKRRASATSPRATKAVSTAQRYPRGENEPSALAELKRYSIVVADTGDFEEIAQYSPQDATTNPSLLLKVANKPEYAHLLDKAIAAAREIIQSPQENLPAHNSSTGNAVGNATSSGSAPAPPHEDEALIEEAVDRLFVLYGVEILKRVPGVVSTEIPADLSFDIEGSIQKARKLISLYEKESVDRSRVLIKLASTWEGCEAAKRLEKENIHCNMTLLFSFCQAVAAAEARATLVSPFVGRILDWHKQQDKINGTPPVDYEGDEDPGVQRVKRVYRYFKRHDFKTVVMAASFRNIGEIISLAGCDKVTVSPALLAELEACSGSIVTRRLGVADAAAAGAAKGGEGGSTSTSGGSSDDSTIKNEKAETNATSPTNKPTGKVTTGGSVAEARGSHENSEEQDEASIISLDEKSFRWALNEDPMATEKLAEGIRLFNRDLQALKRLVAERIAASTAAQKSEAAAAAAAGSSENVETDNTDIPADTVEGATAGIQKVVPAEGIAGENV